MSEETRLTSELARRVDGMPDQPFSFEEVRGRARRIRRRRQVAAAAAVTAAVAILVPTALLAGSGGHRADTGPAENPTHAVDPHSQGVPHLEDGVLVHTDGQRLRLDTGGDAVDGFAILGDAGYVLTVQSDGERFVEALDTDGHRLASYPLAGGVVVDGTSTAAAWVSPTGVPQVLIDPAEAPQALPTVRGADPTAVAITGDCAAECTVVVHVTGGRGLGPTVEASTSGEVAEGPAAVPAVEDVTSDGTLVAGLDGFADDGIHLCGGVYDVAADAFAWRSCEYNVYDFSPDGAHVATTFSEGAGPRDLHVHDPRTGEEVAAIPLTDGVGPFAWEDDEHLLVAVREGDETSLVRLGLDGSREAVAGPVGGTDELSLPYVLPAVG